MRSATVSPAYGREYSGRDAALRDWADGKDFVLHTLERDTYCSSRDARRLIDEGYTHLTFRNGRGVVLVNVPIRA